MIEKFLITTRQSALLIKNFSSQMNTSEVNMELEAVGKQFNLAKMINAREKAVQSVKSISQSIHVGMTESEACETANKVLLEHGIDRIWHPTKVRFGTNTTKVFREPSDGNTILAENDIYFIDIGAVWDGHEGDAGDSFTTGNDKEMIACTEAARSLFKAVEKHWRLQKVSGQSLYRYAEEKAKEMGWKLNTDVRGHRLSDFPHAIYKAGSLGNFSEYPSTGLWILEIQITHPTRAFGAFYEDLLIEQ